jgi:hypothetical protein
MDEPSAPHPAADADPAAPVDGVTYGYFLCTGFLLADVWFPRTVLGMIGQRLGLGNAAAGSEATQRLIANGWLRASPNDRWLKLTPSDELRIAWEQQSEANIAHARHIVQDALLRLAYELQQTSDDETLALVLRHLVHLARHAVAAQDASVADMLVGIGSGFERLGLHAEARAAYDDATSALLKQGALHDEAT